MKKKWLLGVVLAVALSVLAGCVPLSGGSLPGTLGYLRALNSGRNEYSKNTAGSDTVTISREEYERYRQLDEILELK